MDRKTLKEVSIVPIKLAEVLASICRALITATTMAITVFTMGKLLQSKTQHRKWSSQVRAHSCRALPIPSMILREEAMEVSSLHLSSERHNQLTPEIEQLGHLYTTEALGVIAAILDRNKLQLRVIFNHSDQITDLLIDLTRRTTLRILLKDSRMQEDPSLGILPQMFNPGQIQPAIFRSRIISIIKMLITTSMIRMVTERNKTEEIHRRMIHLPRAIKVITIHLHRKISLKPSPKNTSTSFRSSRTTKRC